MTNKFKKLLGKHQDFQQMIGKFKEKTEYEFIKSEKLETRYYKEKVNMFMHL